MVPSLPCMWCWFHRCVIGVKTNSNCTLEICSQFIMCLLYLSKGGKKINKTYTWQWPQKALRPRPWTSLGLSPTLTSVYRWESPSETGLSMWRWHKILLALLSGITWNKPHNMGQVMSLRGHGCGRQTVLSEYKIHHLLALWLWARSKPQFSNPESGGIATLQNCGKDERDK